MSNYLPIIGLEIHVELCTKSKMFCGCSADWFGKEPNTQTCPVCLALPGALPVPNGQAIQWAALIARALGCEISTQSKFDRKHYFYPDLPKGYQISQYDQPIGHDGEFSYLVVDHQKKTFDRKSAMIKRVHLEEDTGKLMHEGGKSYVDLNRAGVPLVEIVTEPVFHSAEDVKAFLEEIHGTIQQLGVSDVNLDQGSMRLEPNISLKEMDNGQLKFDNKVDELPSYKVEVKNINSFKFAANAVSSEIIRHTELLDKGETPIQETRGYDEASKSTVSQRTKEDAHDYRYFPEPDIPPFYFDEKNISKLNTELTNHTQPAVALENRYNELVGKGIDEKKAFDFTFTSLSSGASALDKVLEKNNEDYTSYAIRHLLQNPGLAESELYDRFESEKKSKGVMQDSTFNLQDCIDEVISANADVVESFKKGNVNAINVLLGSVMQASKGMANAGEVRDMLLSKLD